MYQLISPQVIYQFFGDDDNEMLKDMIEIILETNLKDLKELEESYEEKDFATIKKRCHKAKPSMSYIGAVDTRKILEEIEQDLEHSHNRYLELLKHLRIIEKELNEFLKKLK